MSQSQAPEDGKRAQRIAPRREVLFLPLAALVLLALLSIYTLLSYRSTVVLLLEERQAEAAQLARQLSSELVSARSLPNVEALRHRLPRAGSVSILNASGDAVVGTAPIPTGVSEAAVGEARFMRGGETLTVRVELPAALLRSRQRGLDVLTPVLISVAAASILLVLLFLRRFLAPFDQLVEKARHAGQEVPDTQDEVLFLVETFEKALEALAQPADGGSSAEEASQASAPQASASQDSELKALENTLARSLESGVLLLDSQGVILALNEIGAALLDVDAGRTGESISVVLARHPRLVRLLERAVRRGRSVQREECTIESGHQRVLGVTAHPLRRDDNALRGFLVIFADLTEVQKEIREQRLVESLSQLGELTAGVAHELRNSLATLRGYLTLIERGPEDDSIGDYLGEIRRESDHLQRVLEDFLTFARPGSARLQEVDLLSLVHRAAADPALGPAAITVVTEDGGVTEDGEAESFQVRGDPQLLERALRNVLSNAIEAQREAGRSDSVRARLVTQGSGVAVLIEDRGMGIAEDVREKVFDPFFSQRAGGVGMGLALTRRIVLLHGGRVTLEGRSGGGIRATIWIPHGTMVTKGND